MNILFPPGRMVGGNLDKLFPRTETNGQPKIGRDGKPEMQCAFGYAIPKTQARWMDEFYQHPTLGQIRWGADIYSVGASAHPQLVASPAFSWKILDGDSQLPNKKGKKPCDQVGHAGHWVIWLSQGWLPTKCTADGMTEITAEGAIVPGYYIQVSANVVGNKLVPNGTPGVYMNPVAVALIGEGDKIAQDVDTKTLGFGGAPLPPGARPVQPAVGGFAPPVAPPAADTPPAAPAPLRQVVPNPAILNVAPPAPTPAAPVGPQMTVKAAGATYESFIAGGWNEAQMREQGYLV